LAIFLHQHQQPLTCNSTLKIDVVLWRVLQKIRGKLHQLAARRESLNSFRVFVRNAARMPAIATMLLVERKAADSQRFGLVRK